MEKTQIKIKWVVFVRFYRARFFSSPFIFQFWFYLMLFHKLVCLLLLIFGFLLFFYTRIIPPKNFPPFTHSKVNSYSTEFYNRKFIKKFQFLCQFLEREKFLILFFVIANSSVRISGLLITIILLSLKKCYNFYLFMLYFCLLFIELNLKKTEIKYENEVDTE